MKAGWKLCISDIVNSASQSGAFECVIFIELATFLRMRKYILPMALGTAAAVEKSVHTESATNLSTPHEQQHSRTNDQPLFLHAGVRGTRVEMGI